MDFRPAQGFIPDRTPDIEVLTLAAAAGPVLVSRDIRTLPKHFAVFTGTCSSPGVILVPSRAAIGEAIRRLLIAWTAWAAEDSK